MSTGGLSCGSNVWTHHDDEHQFQKVGDVVSKSTSIMIHVIILILQNLLSRMIMAMKEVAVVVIILIIIMFK